MSRSFKIKHRGFTFRGVAALCLLLGLTACAAPNSYRRLNGFPDRGYTEDELGFGKFLVSYHGKDLEFCKKAGMYRMAELCVEKGFRYFKVTDEEVRSTFAPLKRQVGDESDRQGPPEALDAKGLQPQRPVAGYNTKAEFYKTDPMQGKVSDAQEILDTWPVPGTKMTRKETEAPHGN